MTTTTTSPAERPAPPKFRIGARNYPLTLPYSPAVYPQLVGMDSVVRLIQAAFLQTDQPPLNVLLVGGPGTGKTSLAAEAARRLGRPLQVLQCNEGISAEELAVTARPARRRLDRIEYLLSPVASAMACGALLLLDEVLKLRPRVLGALCSVLDHRRVLASSLAGFTLHAHPDFRVIATTNASDFASAAIPDWLAERLSVRLEVKSPSAAELEQIVRARVRESEETLERFLKSFWELWPARSGGLPSPRRLLQVAQLSFNLAALAHRPVTAREVADAIDTVAA